MSNTNCFVLALDIGTSSVRALVYDAGGRALDPTRVGVDHAMRTASDGTAEFEATTLLREVEQCLDQLFTRWREPIAAVATSQMVTNLLGVDEDGAPVSPVYTYADTRSAEFVERLRDECDDLAIHRRTGCRLHTSFWPARFPWLQSNHPDLLQRAHWWMSFGEFLLLRLSGQAMCSPSVASWTGLLDRATGDWDVDWLARLPLRREQLAPVAQPMQSVQGLVSAFANRWPRLREALWYPPLSDGVASNLGSGCVTSQRVALSVGTSGALRVVVDPRSNIPPGLFCYQLDARRSLAGGALNDAGSVFAWLRNTVHLRADDLESELAFLPPDGHGLTMLPFLTGERSPGWNPRARFTLQGATPDTLPLELLHAALEAVALRFAAVFDEVEQVAPDASEIIASGGALANSPAWTQIIADALGHPVIASAEREPSARGAALLALESLGVLQLGDAPAQFGRTFEPRAEAHEVYCVALERQRELYARLFG